MKFTSLACLFSLGVAGLSMLLPAAEQPPDAAREQSRKAHSAGNFRDAYAGYRKLALDRGADRLHVAGDLDMAVTCLQQLGRAAEIDEFREAVIEVHQGNWRLLQGAATSYLNTDHHGFIVAGKFLRGGRRGGGRFVSALQRDRVRALQLMQLALPLALKDDDRAAVSQLHLEFAQAIAMGATYGEAWRLQALTDLAQLPDYDEGNSWGRGSTQGAPVDAEGNPVLHHIPKSFEASQSDGERWRWMLAQTVELNPQRRSEIDLLFANFLHEQFGVQTMAQFGRWPGGGDLDDDGKKNESGTYALFTLGEDETIARLATGIKRFKLPDEFNFIHICQEIAGRGKSVYGERALELLCQTFEDRRQYVRAAEFWKRLIAEYGPGNNNHRQDRLDQIVGNWGRFDPVRTQPAGKGATVDFRFRNGTRVSFEAAEINVSKLLADVKAYLKKSPGQLDHHKLNIGDLGYRLVQQNEQEYLGAKVAAWELELKPRPRHVDERITVTTPLQKPGAYLVTAKMADGNVSRIILWVADTVIVKKPLEGKSYYYIADAVTGRPVAKANVEFFGWKQIQVQPNKNAFRIVTANFAEFTDNDGQVILDQKKLLPEHQWLITARTGEGRLAYLGFTGVWYPDYYDSQYNATRVFTITDRPVYRPDQPVKFKFWIAGAKYDQPDESPFANRKFTVQINDPKGEKVFEKELTTDAYGGLDGEYPLPKGATLGVYGLQIVNYGGGSFRVEEYKKPEFEVKVDAPKEPVRLGEKITATIQAKYYFGAPVVKAKVKYKVLRTTHASAWYPRAPWDWFYGTGYWWFAADYSWYPGWGSWGCVRPSPPWWGQPQQPPEVVTEAETTIGPDGTLKVEFDTRPAKDLHGDHDHKYTITAEVVDESRRTIVGAGSVLVARKPFQVFAWVDRGHYRAGDTIHARFNAHTLDQKPVEGKGELTLYAITYDDKQEPVEKAVESWKLDTSDQGHAEQQIKASKKGQYRLSYRLTDTRGHTIEGAYVFVITGEGFDGHEFRFNDLELVTDKREYAPGEKVRLLINTNRTGGAVLLFLRPANGICLAPKVIRLDGKSAIEEIDVFQKDMPNFFIEALTIADSRLHSELREVIVPPEKRVLNVAVVPSDDVYKPGAPAKVKVRLTDFFGKPFVGSTVLSIYDRSLEYIAGGSNVPEIREFFWKWRRTHHPQTESTLDRWFQNLIRQPEKPMANLGVFGDQSVDEMNFDITRESSGRFQGRRRMKGMGGGMFLAAPASPMSLARGESDMAGRAADRTPADDVSGGEGGDEPGVVQPVVRSQFADTAFWAAAIVTNNEGLAEISLKMPENLTGWKVKAWSMGPGTRVGQGEAEVVTRKNLLVRLQAPRFFVEKDEVVLSANVHNDLKTAKPVEVVLEVEGGTLAPLGALSQKITIEAHGEARIDWRMKVNAAAAPVPGGADGGIALVRVKALTDEESDAMEQKFPVYIHGMLKMESFSGVIRPERNSATITLNVPAERRINDSRIEVRYSPTLAGAMVDALPYLVDYPYGCTEQTLNRFLPTVIAQNILLRMKLNLKDIRDKQTNLNAQEIGDDRERAKGWKRYDRNPVFDEEEVRQMVKDGLQALTAMQLSDGGWGWFSGYGEHSWPHTTAVVVHGLQVAKANDVALVPEMLERGIEWLKGYQARQVQLLKNAADQKNHKDWKGRADDLDAFVYMVLVDADVPNNDMLEFLYRDRTGLAVYSKALFGLALHTQQQAEKLAMILQNIGQFLVQDDENQTAYLKLPESNSWWRWYGSENEAHAWYLKLLAKTSPKEEKTSRLVKYLLNNRKHATYWNSTRDTALCIEALADFLVASGEDKPDMTLEVWLDGTKQKEVKIDAGNLFSFDNRFVLFGDAVETGRHTVELRRQGTGPVYFNAYLTNFTLEDFITKAGLEIKVDRRYYKLTRVEKSVKVAGSRGQAADQKVEKYARTELVNMATLKSGDLVEIELEIDSKNDYEYLVFEDMKASGFEPVEVRSGYGGNDMGAYMELRDERVSFFVRALARGKHSLAYRLRAEIPGKFSALPTRAAAMYAPELKANSDEIKLSITD
jgi:uncharacterized protein YfaS (alpha-2-macroglobulin family)